MTINIPARKSSKPFKMEKSASLQTLFESPKENGGSILTINDSKLDKEASVTTDVASRTEQKNALVNAENYRESRNVSEQGLLPLSNESQKSPTSLDSPSQTSPNEFLFPDERVKTTKMRSKWKIILRAIQEIRVTKLEDHALEDPQNCLALVKLALIYLESHTSDSSIAILHHAMRQSSARTWDYWNISARVHDILSREEVGWKARSRFFLMKFHSDMYHAIEFIQNLADPKMLWMKAKNLMRLGHIHECKQVMETLTSTFHSYARDPLVMFLLAQIHLQVRNIGQVKSIICDKLLESPPPSYTKADFLFLSSCIGNITKPTKELSSNLNVDRIQALAEKCLLVGDYIMSSELYTIVLSVHAKKKSIKSGAKSLAHLFFWRSLAYKSYGQTNSAKEDLKVALAYHPNSIKMASMKQDWDQGYRKQFKIIVDSMGDVPNIIQSMRNLRQKNGRKRFQFCFESFEESSSSVTDTRSTLKAETSSIDISNVSNNEMNSDPLSEISSTREEEYRPKIMPLQTDLAFQHSTAESLELNCPEKPDETIKESRDEEISFDMTSEEAKNLLHKVNTSSTDLLPHFDINNFDPVRRVNSSKRYQDRANDQYRYNRRVSQQDILREKAKMQSLAPIIQSRTETRRKSRNLIDPPPDLIQARRLHSIESFLQLGYTTGSSSYIQYWESLLSLVVKLFPSPQQLKKAIMHVKSFKGYLTFEEAFCALAESQGNVEEASGKLSDNTYFQEIQNICAILDVESFLPSNITAICENESHVRKANSRNRSRNNTSLTSVISVDKNIANSNIEFESNLNTSPIRRKTRNSSELPSSLANIMHLYKSDRRSSTSSVTELLHPRPSSSLRDSKSVKTAQRNGRTVDQIVSDRPKTAPTPSKTSPFLCRQIDQAIHFAPESSNLSYLIKERKVLRVDSWGRKDRFSTTPTRSAPNKLFSPLQVELGNFHDANRYNR